MALLEKGIQRQWCEEGCLKGLTYAHTYTTTLTPTHTLITHTLTSVHKWKMKYWGKKNVIKMMTALVLFFLIHVDGGDDDKQEERGLK